MLLRVIKEQFHADGAPVLDMSCAPAAARQRRHRAHHQPKTGAAETYLPGETFEPLNPWPRRCCSTRRRPSSPRSDTRRDWRVGSAWTRTGKRSAERSTLASRSLIGPCSRRRSCALCRSSGSASSLPRTCACSSSPPGKALRSNSCAARSRRCSAGTPRSSRISRRGWLRQPLRAAPGQPASDVPPDTSTAALVAPPAAVSEPTAQPGAPPRKVADARTCPVRRPAELEDALTAEKLRQLLGDKGKNEPSPVACAWRWTMDTGWCSGSSKAGQEQVPR